MIQTPPVHPNPKPQLIPALAAFAPALVIFDKDGTLIDFHAMWGSWLAELARRLEAGTGLPLAQPLFRSMGFDPVTNRIIANGPLALAPVLEIHKLIIQVLQATGLTTAAAETALAAAWHIPDPIKSAYPLTDLVALFSTFQSYGSKIAIATSDDRPQTEETLVEFRIASLVDALICADDGLPIKPAPDMILAVCATLEIPPARAVMVGDNVPDLQMGHAAGVGLTIGVLSGLASSTELEPYADLLLPSVDDLFSKV
jgi:phosphoglycolate phosphatase-like HAD superfamily hydrolase